MTTGQTSEHYRGEKGKAYFVYQNQGDSQRGRINARKFAPYIKPMDKVLDFGCGNGSLLLHIDCKQKIGVEVNPAAREAAQQSGMNVHEVLDTVPNQSVDIVISNHALEHVLCPHRMLCDLREKLVVGGCLVLCLPLDDWRTQRQINTSDINHHLYTWTPLLIGNLLNDVGYKVKKVWIYTHAWPPYNWQKLDDRLPIWLFDLICTFTAWRYKRRQIIAVARKE